jgi:hypothetical protein
MKYICVDGCRVDLVKQMQLGGDLENSWMMFDHVKHVQSCTTMACHIYDHVYCKVMSIAICNMQLEDIKITKHAHKVTHCFEVPRLVVQSSFL